MYTMYWKYDYKTALLVCIVLTYNKAVGAYLTLSCAILPYWLYTLCFILSINVKVAVKRPLCPVHAICYL